MVQKTVVIKEMHFPVAVGAEQMAFLGLLLDVSPGTPGEDITTEPAFLVLGIPMMDIKHLRVINPFAAFALATQMRHQFAFDVGPALVLILVLPNAFPPSFGQFYIPR